MRTDSARLMTQVRIRMNASLLDSVKPAQAYMSLRALNSAENERDSESVYGTRQKETENAQDRW